MSKDSLVGIHLEDSRPSLREAAVQELQADLSPPGGARAKKARPFEVVLASEREVRRRHRYSRRSHGAARLPLWGRCLGR